MEIIYKSETYKIIGAAMQVHSVLGCGFLEAVYHEAFAIELQKRGVPFECEKQLLIRYGDIVLKKQYQADFVCYNKIIVEIKALSTLTENHQSQILNYLKAASFKVGLLINFGTESLEYERYIL